MRERKRKYECVGEARHRCETFFFLKKKRVERVENRVDLSGEKASIEL